ncbi:endo-1,4-beta-xylanase [Pararcticibacter amylolyticus]|uniref:Beta-xylanase n=1 Tax=Pararcticibacter amylolyticus TaxID=2173175 RepID=A0A2U2PIW6_9SPHI|nr:endo-1,4-beta-xylanase [Pararcticibacter amylolyticus]PWG81320.1 glycoside hydrolase [Pararcticibacter amylolyticus]
MKYLYKIAAGVTFTAVMASCSKHEFADYHVDKPASFDQQEIIDAYQPLKTYLNTEANPGFKFGVALSLTEYENKGVKYRLANTNFNEIVLGYEMKHGAVVRDNGRLDLTTIKALLKTAKNAGIDVYGHTLCWHANQNASYLKKLIAPIIIPGNGIPAWVPVTSNNFESDDRSNYEANTNAILSFTAAGQGAGGQGRALKITNESVRPNDWDAQFFIKFSPAVKTGEQYELSMDVRADANVSIPTQAHVVPYSYKHYDFFGSIPFTSSWTRYTKTITVSTNMADCGAIAFNLGKNATNYYFDNITLKKYDETGGAQTIERTAEEKKTIITNALQQFISGMVDTCKSYVKAWDVVNEPMDDGRPNELKTGLGKTLAADEFYWQDYMGKDYAAEAFKIAREHCNTGDKLFINDYNLEYSLDKCRGLIAYVEYIESKGARVDGIGTQMHISINSDKGKIAEMFTLLAATGKYIKVSELDIGLGENVTAALATAEQYKAQADMYKYVIDKYFELIPASKRYGLTIWSPTDSPANSSWRAGQPVGLWTEDFTRKPAYTGVAEGLKGK